MADATRTVRSVEKTVTVDEDVVTLTMTVDEAYVLRAILSRVHGDPTDSPRKHSREVWLALRGVGVTFENAYESYGLLSGGIYFAEYPNGA